MGKNEPEEGQVPEAVESGVVSDDVLGVVSGGMSAEEIQERLNISFN